VIEILEPAQDRRLTTLATVKEELKLADSTKESLLQTLINQASAFVERYCNRTFALQKYKETIAAHGSLYLPLSMRPVIAVDTVEENGHPITDYVLETPDSGLLYRRVGWGWKPMLNWVITWQPLPNADIQTYEVVYTAGYILPNDTARTLPYDIERACIEIIKGWYVDIEAGRRIQSESIGDYSVTYARDMPTDILRTLDGWRNWL